MYFLYTFIICLFSTNAMEVHDSFTGKVLTEKEYEQHKKSNTTFWCTNEIIPCDAYEGRRVDGSCNNLKHPSMGTRHSPLYHVLPLVFDKGNNIRKSKSGEDLPLSRAVRTTLLLEGRAPDHQFTHLLPYFMLFMAADVLSFHDTVNYLAWTTHCCEARGKTDPQCIRVKIPDDDPVHRFSNERCFNLTHPWTFQSKNCTVKTATPERIVSVTALMHLSQIYAGDNKILVKKARLLKNGLLKYEVDDERVWPPSFKTANICVANKPHETRCHDIGDDSVNGILGTNLFAIWMWRHHNFIANELSRLNPCWDDERLFNTARDINIATAVQIFYYELNSLLLGQDNLYKDNVLSSTLGFRDLYDENILPQVSLEYGFVLRWTHTIQEGIGKMYDTKGNYLKSTRIANLTLRTGYLAVDNNIDYLTQGAFRQATGKIDNAVDPDIAEVGLGPLQRIADVTTSDLEKNRYFGLAPYIKFREYCFGEVISTFEDLIQAIDPEKVELLKELYDDVADIDLLAGMWVERPITGARVPASFYCLVVEQLRRFAVSDRHWYERPNRPNAFTIQQLLEIRKATAAGLLCEVGDKVTKIQPSAFLIPGPGNDIQSCDDISRINLDAWKDEQCDNNSYKNEVQ